MRDSASGLRAGRSYQFDDIIEPRDTRTRIAMMLARTPRHTPRQLSKSAGLELATMKKHAIDLR
jgi:hypothetical protein